MGMQSQVERRRIVTLENAPAETRTPDFSEFGPTIFRSEAAAAMTVPLHCDHRPTPLSALAPWISRKVKGTALGRPPLSHAPLPPRAAKTHFADSRIVQVRLLFPLSGFAQNSRSP